LKAVKNISSSIKQTGTGAYFYLIEGSISILGKKLTWWDGLGLD